MSSVAIFKVPTAKQSLGKVSGSLISTDAKGFGLLFERTASQSRRRTNNSTFIIN